MFYTVNADDTFFEFEVFSKLEKLFSNWNSHTDKFSKLFQSSFKFDYFTFISEHFVCILVGQFAGCNNES